MIPVEIPVTVGGYVVGHVTNTEVTQNEVTFTVKMHGHVIAKRTQMHLNRPETAYQLEIEFKAGT